MKVVIYTIESEVESARRMGYETTTYLGDYAHKFDDKIVIRWGNSRWLYNREGSRQADLKNVINPAANIRTNCEKAKATKLLSQVVNTPTLWETKVPADVLAVVRPHEHSAGSGFSVQKGPFTVPSGHYAVRYLKTDAEYRVWFCGNRTMCGRRVKMECNPTEEYPCRSKWGYEFCDGIAKDLRNQTLLAAKKIGLEFGAADVLYFKGKWYFLELNSAPSVDHRIVREFYQSAMAELIEKKFPSKKEETTLVPVVEINSAEAKKKEENPLAVGQPPVPVAVTPIQTMVAA